MLSHKLDVKLNIMYIISYTCMHELNKITQKTHDHKELRVSFNVLVNESVNVVYIHEVQNIKLI